MPKDIFFKRMKSLFLFTICLIYSTIISCQEYTRCRVYQNNITDTICNQLVEKIKYNKSGKIIKDRFLKDYKSSFNVGMFSYVNKYKYDDSLLVKVLTSKDGNKLKIKNIYSDSNKLIREFHSEYRSIPRKELFKGYRNLVYFLRNMRYKIFGINQFFKKWVDTKTIEYMYADNGNLERKTHNYFVMDLFDKDKEYWEYNSLGQIIKHKEIINCNSNYVDYYKYFDNGYIVYTYQDKPDTTIKVNCTKYNYDFYKKITLNNNQQEIEEVFVNGDGKISRKKITEYNDAGLIARTFSMDSMSDQVIIHKYIYSPVRKRINKKYKSIKE